MTKFTSTKRLLVTTASFAIMLSGCSTLSSTLANYGPQMRTPDIAGQAGALNPPSSWAFGPATDQAIVDSWVSIINDTQLLNLINTALKSNPSLQASAESIARSQALLDDASGHRFVFGYGVSPSLSSPLENFDIAERYSGGLSASWEADLWGRIDADITGAEFDLAGAKAVYESARQSLTAQVVRTYLSAIESRLQRDLTDATLQAQLETQRIVNVRYDLGAAARSEQVLSQSDVAGARDNLEVAQANLRGNIRALQALMGQYPDGKMNIPLTFPNISTSVYAGQPIVILRRRPDILIAEYNVRGAFASEYITRTGNWPSLSLSGDFDTSVSDLGDLLDPAGLALSVGARLAGTLFDDAGDRILAAEASSRQTLSNYGQTVLDAFTDVEGSLDDIALIEQRIIYVQQAADAARETLRLAELQYKEGSLDLLDVLTFRQRSFQADRTLLSIQRQALDARIALYLALGGGAVPTQ